MHRWGSFINTGVCQALGKLVLYLCRATTAREITLSPSHQIPFRLECDYMLNICPLRFHANGFSLKATARSCSISKPIHCGWGDTGFLNITAQTLRAMRLCVNDQHTLFTDPLQAPNPPPEFHNNPNRPQSEIRYEIKMEHKSNILQ